MTWDYVFVGAGPATLTAAALLAESRSCSILILEAGGSFTKRGCPGLGRQTCTACSADCRVTMGVGGASAGFGNKLCEFPASSSLLSLIPQHLLPHVQNIVAAATGVATATEQEAATGAVLATRKFYDVHVLSRTEYRSVLQELLSALPEKVKLRSEVHVRRVSRSGKDFELCLGSGERVLTRNLILAPGRAGHQFMRATLNSLGAAFHENNVDVGI